MSNTSNENSDEESVVFLYEGIDYDEDNDIEESYDYFEDDCVCDVCFSKRNLMDGELISRDLWDQKDFYS